MTKLESAHKAVGKLAHGHGIPLELYEALQAILAAIGDGPSGPEPDPEIAHLPRRE